MAGGQPVAALIIRVAADMADLKTSVGDINTTLGNVTSGAQKLAAGLAAAFSFSDVAAGVSRLQAAAGQVADLSSQIGIGAEAVQRLKFAAEQSGSSIDAVANGIKIMANNLTDGGKGTVAGLDALNLGLDALRGMSPDQAFTAIAEAIRKVPDPMQQSALAVDLFGRSGAELLPAIKNGISEIGAAAPIMADSTVSALDTSADKWDELQGKLDAVKADALAPLVDMFLELPSTVQVAAGGIASFLPSLESIGLAVMAAGGPTAAFASLQGALAGLVTFLGGAVATAFGALVTFLTVTLPGAFAAIMPFLGPIGLIAAGIAAVLLVWKYWDEISAIVSNVYNAVKTYMFDKLNAIWDGVKQKIDAVKGYFAGMYDAVVGNSYVPDMINRIATEFGRLNSVMVVPAQDATRVVGAAFSQLSGSVGGGLSDLVGQIGSLFSGEGQGGIAGIFNLFQAGPLSSLTTAIDEAFGTRASDAMAKLQEIFRDGQRVVAGVLRGMSGDVTGWVDATLAAISLVRKAWDGIKGIFGGGEEGTQVNPARDAFLLKFGPGGTGEGSGFANLAAMLASFGGSDLFSALTGADRMDKFNSAVQAITALLHERGVPGFMFGSGGFRDFGGGTLAMLHGRERVQTESQVTAEQGAFASAIERLGMAIEQRMNQQSRDFAAQIAVARGRGASYAT